MPRPPGHRRLNYQLACFRTLSGELDIGARHLRRAVASDDRAWEWPADGGRIALDLAASRPDRVAGLVLADAGLPDHEWSAEIRAFGAAEDEALEAGDLDRATEVSVDFWLPDASEAVRAAVRDQQRDAFALQVGADGEETLLTEDLPTRLGALDVPAFVLAGDSDYDDFHALADRLAATLLNARRETIRGAGHLPSLEQPEAFDAVVLPFLAALP